MPAWVQAMLRSLASQMLSQGKTQEDTAWYISYNYHLTEDSVKQMVKTQAKKPVTDQQKLIETTIKILNVGQELYGCKIAGNGLGSVTPGVVSYCQGVTAPVGQKATTTTAATWAEGSNVDHSTGSQLIAVETTPDSPVWDTRIKYRQALQGNYQARMKGVIEVLKDLGFPCQAEGQVISCEKKGQDGDSMSVLDMDLTRRAALFLSSIDKVNELPATCIPKAIEYAAEHARGVNKTAKPWTVPVFPATVDDWMKQVCEKV